VFNKLDSYVFFSNHGKSVTSSLRSPPPPKLVLPVCQKADDWNKKIKFERKIKTIKSKNPSDTE
jgi:hypothetical protein